jgi:hypothetical protein
MFHSNCGKIGQQDYCHTCGEVFFQYDLKIMKIQDGLADIVLCEKHWVKIPDYIPTEQKRRWYLGVRTKSIQSDDQKRRERRLG